MPLDRVCVPAVLLKTDDTRTRPPLHVIETAAFAAPVCRCDRDELAILPAESVPVTTRLPSTVTFELSAIALLAAENTVRAVPPESITWKTPALNCTVSASPTIRVPPAERASMRRPAFRNTPATLVCTWMR